MKRFQSISENLSYNDILQLDGAFSALHINYGKSPLFNGENSKDLYQIIYVFLTIFLYLLKRPQSLILSALRAFCLCGKPHISKLIFLYFPCQSWLKSW